MRSKKPFTYEMSKITTNCIWHRTHVFNFVNRFASDTRIQRTLVSLKKSYKKWVIDMLQEEKFMDSLAIWVIALELYVSV